MITETVYLDRDNTIDLLLTADGNAVNLVAVTQMELIDDGGKFFISSDTSVGVFDWASQAGSGIVTIALGGLTLPLGTHTCSLTVFDPSNTDGIVWDKLKITVKALYQEPAS